MNDPMDLLRQENEWLKSDNRVLRAKLDEACEALVFYANKKVYEPDSVGRFSDLTFRARFVLKLIKGGGDEG